MKSVILSNYSNINNDGLFPHTINIDVNLTKFNIGDLIIKESYKNEDNTFSYSKETMLIISIQNNEELSITVKPVIRIDLGRSNPIAYVSNYDENLYYINEKWYNESNIDSGKSCESIKLVTLDGVANRTNISKGLLFEENGKIVTPPKNVKSETYKPIWCSA